MSRGERRFVTVRRMRVADINRVAEIYAEILDSTYISFSELAEGKARSPTQLSRNAVSIFLTQVRALINSKRHGFFVAVGTDAVGFALASIHAAEAGHLECWLDDVCVTSEWQRRGVARQLIKRVLQWGYSKEVKYFLLESGIRNKSAHQAFLNLGFEPLATVFWHAAPDDKED